MPCISHVKITCEIHMLTWNYVNYMYCICVNLECFIVKTHVIPIITYFHMWSVSYVYHVKICDSHGKRWEPHGCLPQRIPRIHKLFHVIHIWHTQPHVKFTCVMCGVELKVLVLMSGVSAAVTGEAEGQVEMGVAGWWHREIHTD